PDILPSSSSQTGLLPSTTKMQSQASSFKSYITTWDLSSSGLARRLSCILALCFHIPLNILSILSHGVSVLMFVWIILSVLNLLCVGVGLWKLDVMRGQRWFYGKFYKRRNFDYVILGLFVMYGFAFIMFLFVKMRIHNWVTFLRVIWPCLVVADIVCFIAGWVATWQDVSGAPLG
ncbi:hypothetical protein LSUE1_G008775, partial [Lachnellula suecica]